MKHAYYPGCSLMVSNKPYDASVRAVARKLGYEMAELVDWNCCGATAYMSVRELSAFVVSARNLALAEQLKFDDIITACSACYTTLNKTNHYLAENPRLRARVAAALDAAGLGYSGGIQVRHFLDVMVNDIGQEAIKAKVVRKLTGLKVAPYYGCQITRPFATFDDPEQPTSMDLLLSWTGAEPVTFSLKTRCCGGMLMSTYPKVALDLVRALLAHATDAGAQLIVTACPLCQLNLEAYQSQVNSRFATNFALPIAYFTQVVGYALGFPTKELMLHKALVPTEPVFAGLRGG